jgi:hypothetical protein
MQGKARCVQRFVTCLERVTIPLPDVTRMSCCQPWLTDLAGPGPSIAGRMNFPSMRRSVGNYASVLPAAPLQPEQQGMPRWASGVSGGLTTPLGSGAHPHPHLSDGAKSVSSPVSNESGALLAMMGSRGGGQGPGSSGPGSSTQLQGLSEARASSGSGRPARAEQAVVASLRRGLSGMGRF